MVLNSFKLRPGVIIFPHRLFFKKDDRKSFSWYTLRKAKI